MRWRAGTLVTDQASFGSFLALCALSAKHIEKKAVFTLNTSTTMPLVDAGKIYIEALEAVPSDMSLCRGIDCLRSLGLLALYAL